MMDFPKKERWLVLLFFAAAAGAFFLVRVLLGGGAGGGEAGRLEASVAGFAAAGNGANDGGSQRGVGAVSGPFFLNGTAYYVSDVPNGDGLYVGRSYVFRDGGAVSVEQARKILGLRNFYELTKTDPLFYSPYTNVTKLELAAGAYENYEELLLGNVSNRGLAALYGSYKERGAAFNLIPHDFISALPQAVKRTEAFYRHPSYENAEALLSAYGLAAVAYKKGALDLAAIADDLAVIERNVSGGFAGRTVTANAYGVGTSLDVFRKDLELIYENAVFLETLTSERRGVLRYEQFTSPTARKISGVKPAPPARRAIVTAGELAGLEQGLTEGRGVVRGPYEILTPCFGLNDTRHLFYYVRDVRDGPRSDEYYIADVRLYDPTRVVGGNRTAVDDAARWQRVGGAAHCDCLLNDVSALNIRLIDFMLERMAQEGAYSGAHVGAFPGEKLELLNRSIADGIVLERRFLDYPSEQALDALGRNYLETYRILADFEPGAGNGSVGLKKEVLLDYGTAIGSRLFLLGEVMMRNVNGPRERGKLYGGLDLYSGEVVIEDSLYPLLFAPYSRAVWRISRQPQYFLGKEYAQTFKITGGELNGMSAQGAGGSG